MALTTTFDLTFDQTFQGLAPAVGPVVAQGCRLPGTYMMWLCDFGWAYYLFRGNTDTDFDARSAGIITQGGLDLDTQRITRPILTIRAGGLTQADSDIIRTIAGSVHVYVLAPGADGKVVAARVRVEEGTFATWREDRARVGLAFKITFAAHNSQRI